MNEITKEIIGKFNKHQKIAYDTMQNVNKLTISFPTGVGKGFLMINDIILRILNTEQKVFTILTHRLLLNAQHFEETIDKISDHTIGNIAYVFIGSDNINVDYLNMRLLRYNRLNNTNLSGRDLLFHPTKEDDITELITNLVDSGKKVVIVCTYNSSNKLSKIQNDVVYCDEAHKLAAEKDTEFVRNFKMLKTKNQFFFSATPKKLGDTHYTQQDIQDMKLFLMNNRDIFGEEVGLSYHEAIMDRYIVEPKIHIAFPEKLIGYANITINDKIKFILDSFNKHNIDFVKRNSNNPDKIEAKLLLRVNDINDDGWEIYSKLLNNNDGINIAYSSSEKGRFINNKEFKKRRDFIEALKNLKDTDRLIAIHNNTLTEGINVKGFTGFMPFCDKIMTNTALTQNAGRVLRLVDEDRIGIVSGEIGKNEQYKMIKPFSAIILPFWDTKTEANVKSISKTIYDFRDNIGFKAGVELFELGDDDGTGNKEVIDIETILGDKKEKKDLVEYILHELEKVEIDEEAKQRDLHLKSLLSEGKHGQYIDAMLPF